MARRCGDHMKPVKQSRNQVCISAGVAAPHQWATSMTSALPRCLHAHVDFLLFPISQQVYPFLSLLHVCFSARNHQKIKGHCCFCFFFNVQAVCLHLRVLCSVSHPSCFDALSCQSHQLKVKASCTFYKSSFWTLNHPEMEELCSIA